VVEMKLELVEKIKTLEEHRERNHRHPERSRGITLATAADEKRPFDCAPAALRSG
jgi:hypothetical protein